MIRFFAVHKVRSLVATMVAVLVFAPRSASAQALPPVDDFFGVRLLSTGASAAGGAVTRDNTSDITTTALFAPALVVTNSVPGYGDDVLNPIRNFDASHYSFGANSVWNANGSPAAIGAPATARRVDGKDNTIAGAAGKFTINANGTYSYDPGTDLADLQTGQSARVAVDYRVHGVNTTNQQPRDFAATLTRR